MSIDLLALNIWGYSFWISSETSEIDLFESPILIFANAKNSDFLSSLIPSLSNWRSWFKLLTLAFRFSVSLNESS